MLKFVKAGCPEAVIQAAISHSGRAPGDFVVQMAATCPPSVVGGLSRFCEQDVNQESSLAPLWGNITSMPFEWWAGLVAGLGVALIAWWVVDRVRR